MNEETKTFRCTCGRDVNSGGHCQNCLTAKHTEDSEGYECGGTLSPIGIWVNDGRWNILQKCNVCGEIVADTVNDGDNPLLLMSIASKPLAMPPFPIEKLEELAKLSGGVGDTKGYYNE